MGGSPTPAPGLLKYILKERKQINLGFATNSDCLIPKSEQSNVVDLRYFKLVILFDQITVIEKYQWFTPSDRKDIGIRIFDFVTKTQFL